jgi:hypothetical protein
MQSSEEPSLQDHAVAARMGIIILKKVKVVLKVREKVLCYENALCQGA